MTQQLIIIGAGGHGRVCAEIAARNGFAVAGFCDRAFTIGNMVNGAPVVAVNDRALLADWPADTQIFVALGNNERRIEVGKLALEQGITLATLIDPTAIVSSTAEIGAGCVLMANVVINANARISAHCILNTACTIDHDGDLSEGVQIGPGVHAAGDVAFGDRSSVGIGASLIPGVRVGRDAIVGAGAVVVRDVPDRATFTGVPARPINRQIGTRH